VAGPADGTWPPIPLFEFDPSPRAVIDPSRHTGRARLPRHAVACWFRDVVDELCGDLDPVYRVDSESGPFPIWVFERDGRPLAVFHPGVGAPMAVSCLEVVIALGATHIIGCGGAGVVVPGFDVGHVVVPTRAVRDEGTSYHYAAHDHEARPHPDAVAAIEAELTAAGVPWEAGTTWTTDAFFRETAAKVARRRAEGCITVEMEASAFFTVAAFRNVVYGQVLYAGDDVSSEEWDHRGWDRHDTARRHLFDLACGAALRL
jgi:uridine phosphorylase